MTIREDVTNNLYFAWYAAQEKVSDALSMSEPDPGLDALTAGEHMWAGIWGRVDSIEREFVTEHWSQVPSELRVSVLEHLLGSSDINELMMLGAIRRFAEEELEKLLEAGLFEQIMKKGVPAWIED